jgi:hypothetical protein
MPRFKPVVRTYNEERFYEPELLMRARVEEDPESQQGVRSRVIMEVLRANTRYYFRKFAHGQPTATFEMRVLNPGSCYQFGLKQPASKVVHLTDSEGVTLAPRGERPELDLAFEYVRLDNRGKRVVRLAHEFDMEPWSSVRVELVTDGNEESLMMTEYLVDE